MRVHDSAVDPEPDPDERRRADAGGDRRRACMRRRSRSACSSSAASGRRTSASTAASATPTCRSGQIGYPSTGYFSGGKGVLLGAYMFGAPNAYEFTAMPPARARAKAVEYGAQIHPQYQAEFDNGVAVAWHRVAIHAWAASATGPTHAREQHYDNLCAIDGRIVLAGEHASYMPAWQEGAVTSALDAIRRLHQARRRGSTRMRVITARAHSCDRDRARNRFLRGAVKRCRMIRRRSGRRSGEESIVKSARHAT